jgi:hypothetical protein
MRSTIVPVVTSTTGLVSAAPPAKARLGPSARGTSTSTAHPQTMVDSRSAPQRLGRPPPRRSSTTDVADRGERRGGVDGAGGSGSLPLRQSFDVATQPLNLCLQLQDAGLGFTVERL